SRSRDRRRHARPRLARAERLLRSSPRRHALRREIADHVLRRVIPSESEGPGWAGRDPRATHPPRSLAPARDDIEEQTSMKKTVITFAVLAFLACGKSETPVTATNATSSSSSALTINGAG